MCVVRGIKQKICNQHPLTGTMFNLCNHLSVIFLMCTTKHFAYNIKETKLKNALATINDNINLWVNLFLFVFCLFENTFYLSGELFYVDVIF